MKYLEKKANPIATEIRLCRNMLGLAQDCCRIRSESQICYISKRGEFPLKDSKLAFRYQNKNCLTDLSVKSTPFSESDKQQMSEEKNAIMHDRFFKG